MRFYPLLDSLEAIKMGKARGSVRRRRPAPRPLRSSGALGRGSSAAAVRAGQPSAGLRRDAAAGGVQARLRGPDPAGGVQQPPRGPPGSRAAREEGPFSGPGVVGAPEAAPRSRGLNVPRKGAFSPRLWGAAEGPLAAGPGAAQALPRLPRRPRPRAVRPDRLPGGLAARGRQHGPHPRARPGAALRGVRQAVRLRLPGAALLGGHGRGLAALV